MKFLKITVLQLLVLLSANTTASPQQDNPVAVQDGDVVITEQELAYLVTTWTGQMRSVAAEDEGDRLELLNLMMANKRVAAEADELVNDNPELYYQYQHALEGFKRDFVLRTYKDSIESPDFTDLAREQYVVNKNKYALVPETRLSSHILFEVRPGTSADIRNVVREEAQAVLDELRAGADFEEMVTLHSDEPGASQRKGKFDRWIRYGDAGVSAPYVEGLFAIQGVGVYSDLVQTQFGLHIIRLDGIQEKSYKPFEEVAGKIVTDLQNEFIKLSMKDFVTKFNFSDDVMVDEEVVTRVLAPYQPQQ
ncbi:hypothetical protein A3709_08705 [Halioglobus sp. HI00S01]|uniref:peptidylprolyl isomerase n=1 Tax=Halioglobus sp. HI00S01 TaxID=1822214 RepID=UPI0007C379A1|nr:peptidylprolyl isomerase [Halioglobus sp. HI00S01]KZX55064.1 hypothetical protein A3709_08705 [Halioglobus sp. HI00S01]